MKDSKKNNICVIAEHFSGAVQPVTYETTSFASKVTAAMGGKVTVLLLAHPARQLAEEIAGTSGCDVTGIDSLGAQNYNAEVYRALLKKLFEKEKPRLIFVPHTSTGWDFAPALAVDIGASCITAVMSSGDDNGPVFTRQVCNGKIIEDVRPLPDRPAVVTVMPGAEPAPDRNDVESGSVEIIEMDVPPVRSKTVRYVEAPPQSFNLQEAQVIVAVGRGIGDPEHIDIIRELAGAFDRGAVGASRPVVDAGWAPIECQVGMTGQTVSPKVYIACGISGAVQHTMGMKNADVIISINRDKKALFTQTAHYCVVADLHKLIPALIEKIRHFRG